MFCTATIQPMGIGVFSCIQTYRRNTTDRLKWWTARFPLARRKMIKYYFVQFINMTFSIHEISHLRPVDLQIHEIAILRL